MKILILLIALFFGRLYYSEMSDVTVSITGISNGKGRIYINLYTSANGFPTDMSKAVKKISLTAQKPGLKYVFENLPKGTYAISVMHDENNNGKMDKNFFGIPIEGYCVSNNAKGFMSAPSFSDARFEVNKDVVQELKLIY